MYHFPVLLCLPEQKTVNENVQTPLEHVARTEVLFLVGRDDDVLVLEATAIFGIAVLLLFLDSLYSGCILDPDN